MVYDKQLLIEVSLLHYKHKINQEVIAKKLNLSKSQVNRILKKAKDVGIVQINIVDPFEDYIELERKIEKIFKIKKAIIIENLGLSEKELREKLGKAASDYLHEVIKDGDIIGISCGTNFNEVINNYPNSNDKTVEVVQIVSGGEKLPLNLNCHDILRRFAAKFNTEPHLLFTPSRVNSSIMLKYLMRDQAIKEVFKYFKKLNIVVGSIGSITPKITSTLIKSSNISKDEIKMLKKGGVVGDIYSRFIKMNGQIYNKLLSGGENLAISVEDLKKVPYLIGIAGDISKTEAIFGVLKGRHINVLITDHTAAQKVLELETKFSKLQDHSSKDIDLYYKGGELIIS